MDHENSSISGEDWITHDLRAKRNEFLNQKQRWLREARRLRRYFQDSTSRMKKPIMICLDIEAFERDHKIITEIGLTKLDLSDEHLYDARLKGDFNALLTEGIVKSRHLRVQERRHLVNNKFVKGCPDNFDFGSSEWISERNIAGILTTIFNKATIGSGPASIKPILVGHGVKSDIEYLRRIGLDILPLISDCLDTADLDKAIRRNATNRSLGTLLEVYNISARHLHNAGNDAHYTMRVLMSQAFDQGPTRQDKNTKAVALQLEIDKAKAVAEYKTRMQYEGWSDDGADEEDGEHVS